MRKEGFMYIVSNQPRNIVYDKLNQSTSLQGKMNDASEQSIVKKTAPITAPLALVTFCSNKVNSKKSPNGTYIIPKEFPPNNPKAPNLFDVYSDGKEYPYYDYDEANLKAEANAEELQANMPEPGEKVIYVSNLDEPFFTIAGTSTLDKTLYTDNLASCAAMAVVDRANNTQTLIHVFPGLEKKLNRQIIEHIISPADPKNLEISIVHGFNEGTTSTMQFLLDTVEELAPEVTPKLYCFPHKYIRFSERGLMLKDGELAYCNPDYVQNRDVNPKDNITYSKYEKFEWAKAKDITDLLRDTPFTERFDEKELKNWAIDNKLKMGYSCGLRSVYFEDVDGKSVRVVNTELDNPTVVNSDFRYIYDSEGNLIDIIKLKNDK